MIHKLKIDSQPLDDLLSGAKRAEFRRDDRNFQVGDCLEFQRGDNSYHFEILHIQKGYGIPSEYAMLSVAPLTRPSVT